MKTIKLLSGIILGSCLLAGPALAQSSLKGQFITQQSSSEWLGSKLIGLNVYDPQKNKIGDIDQLLVDRTGNVEGVVIGVGGFLGVDKKDVAVPFTSLHWVSQQTANRDKATTGSNTATKSSSDMATDASKGYPDHAVLSMTKDQLKNAPNFHYASDNDKSSNK
ncbi:MAG TPA: PRC-barrel domain-containing protein [Pseudolabrys sp.]